MEYRVQFKIESELGEAQPIVRISGDIFLLDPDTGETSGQAVGTVSAERLDSYQNPLEAADEDSQELCDVACALYAPHGDGENFWSDAVNKALPNALCGNVLYLSRMDIQPEHRGKNLGLHVALRLIETFAADTDLVVCQPFPTDAERNEKFRFKDEVSVRKSEKKLAAYWSKLGFKQLPRKRFLCALYRLYSPEGSRPQRSRVTFPAARVVLCSVDNGSPARRIAPMPMPNCDVCGGKAIGVVCSRIGPISFAYCNRCAEECAEPYGILVGMVAINGGLDNFNEDFHYVVEATLKVVGKTTGEFEADVAKEAVAIEEDLATRELTTE